MPFEHNELCHQLATTTDIEADHNQGLHIENHAITSPIALAIRDPVRVPRLATMEDTTSAVARALLHAR